MFLCGLFALMAGMSGTADTAATLDNPFFAFKNSMETAGPASVEDQAAMLADIGFDGFDNRDLNGLEEELHALDRHGLKLFTVYFSVRIDEGEVPFNPQLPEMLPLLKDRGTVLWCNTTSKKLKPSDTAGDARAVPIFGKIADMAAPYGVRVAPYPHTGMWVETPEDTARLADKVNRPNFGTSFNLFHWRALGDRKRPLAEVVRMVAPRMMVMSINGNDGTTAVNGIGPLQGKQMDEYVEVLQAFHSAGYKGPVGLQCYRIPTDPNVHLRQSMAVWRKLKERFANEAALVPTAKADEFIAVDHQRQTIYHSPQTPGYTCWVGAWTMPDGNLMVSFTQATGPVTGRPQAPEDVRKRLDWPPPGLPDYDMTGLDLRNVHLRSANGGKSWEQASADAFKSCMNGAAGEAETVLPDGTILRGVCGQYLPYNPELPKTGYLERSADGSKTWGKPEVLLDPGKYSTFPKRVRMLRDGRVMVIGGVAPVPADSLNREDYCDLFQPLLMVSKDAGKTWSEPIPVVPAEYRDRWGGEEYDAAELPNGDLLCMFRRRVPELKAEARWQGVLKKSGDTWTVGEVGPAPLPHSGHPELLATREGPILHVATDGIRCTTDAGRTWLKLDLPGTAYYPHAVQAKDGQIFIFGHVGSDDAYGAVDQSIVMDTFHLKKQ